MTCTLQDGWQDTPLAPGDAVHLLAEVTEGPDGLQSVCNYREGVYFQLPLSSSLSCGSCADSKRE